MRVYLIFLILLSLSGFISSGGARAAEIDQIVAALRSSLACGKIPYVFWGGSYDSTIKYVRDSTVFRVEIKIIAADSGGTNEWKRSVSFKFADMDSVKKRDDHEVQFNCRNDSKCVEEVSPTPDLPRGGLKTESYGVKMCDDGSADLVKDAAEAIIASQTVSPPAASQAMLTTKTVKQTVSQGFLYMRDGPGQQHDPITKIPAGTTGVVVGSCQASDDGISKYPWCKVKWNNYQGYASSSGLE
jgi:Bacterial SH3 domain